jgi:hypothetical protein
MRDDSAAYGGDTTEREWRETLNTHVSVEQDCVERAGELTARRRAFDVTNNTGGSDRTRWMLSGLVLLAIPLIVYSGLLTPTGAINYSGLGIGAVLMLAGGLAYL